MVQSVSSSSSSPLSTPPPQATPAKQELGKDSFVRLLMTQLQSQDPTAPQSSEEFVAQLAQFTSVELMQKQNENLESLLLATAASNQTAVSTLVGKDVAFFGDTLSLKEAGEAKDLSLEFAGPAESVLVSIVDGNGKTVRTMPMGAQKAGRFDFSFDGRADDGSPLPEGDYTVKVVAMNNDAPVDVQVMQRGHVDGISFIDGVAQLLVGALKIRLPDVVEIHEREPG